MYTSDPSVRGKVRWFSTDDALSFEMQTPSGFTLRCKATLEADGVAITYNVIGSGSALQIAELEATTCVKLYRPFTDVFLERTYVHEPEGLAPSLSQKHPIGLRVTPRNGCLVAI